MLNYLRPFSKAVSLSRLSALCIFSGSIASFACKARTFNAPEATTASSAGSVAETWRLMRAAHLKDIQLQCEPQRYSPPEGVTPRGVAVLLHGFSACPDQYDVLGPQLAAAGYEVLVPLFPGHGAKPLSLSPRKDDVEGVPRVGAGWGPMVARVNELGQMFQGERVLVGLSHGSNIALRAIQTSPTLWSKAFLMAPKLKNEASFFKFLLSSPIHILSIDQLSDPEMIQQNPADYGEQKLLSMRSGWKKCSEVDSKPPANRGGFCNFENRHAMAMFDLGDVVVKSAESAAAKGTQVSTRVQFVLSTTDNGVCNNSTLKVLNSLRKSGADARACMMPEGVPHSMFSRHDSPYVKPWVPTLFDQVQSFLTDEKFVPGSNEAIAPCALEW